MKVIDRHNVDPRWRKFDRAIRRVARYGGTSRQCPCCGGRWRRFAAHGEFADVRCPACGSLPRQRALWLYLTRHTPLGRAPLVVLHYAPEASLRRALGRVGGLRYTSIDLDSRYADRQMDASSLEFADASFDLLICSHVLEHVADDLAAMREMRRVLRPAGVALLQHPIVSGRVTFEDPAAVERADRVRRFSQEDHVRVYGPDIAGRLHGAGFGVAVIRPEDLVDPGGFHRYGLAEPLAPAVRASDIHRCTARAYSGSLSSERHK